MHLSFFDRERAYNNFCKTIVLKLQPNRKDRNHELLTVTSESYSKNVQQNENLHSQFYLYIKEEEL